LEEIMKFLTFVQNIDWVKLWWVAGIIATFWAMLAGITVIFPAFDPWYKVINIVLGALTGATLFAARGGKYVSDRSELPPQDGKP
jgi:hypothetical protein